MRFLNKNLTCFYGSINYIELIYSQFILLWGSFQINLLNFYIFYVPKSVKDSKIVLVLNVFSVNNIKKILILMINSKLILHFNYFFTLLLISFDLLLQKILSYNLKMVKISCDFIITFKNYYYDPHI